MMNSTTTTLANTFSVRPWPQLAGLVTSQNLTVEFYNTGSDKATGTASVKTISGPAEDTALLVASESPPALATATESAQLPAKTAVKVSRHLMGFGARCTGADSEGNPICLTSETALSRRQPQLTTLPHLVGLEAGSVVLKLDRFANEFEEILTAIEPCGNAK